MQTMRIRIVGDETRAERLVNMIHGMDGVEQIEEIPLPGTYQHTDIEVAVVDDWAAWRIRAFAAGAAMLMDASAEFVDSLIGASPLAADGCGS